MTYQILANKWRPQNFEQVISQDSIVKVLKNSLDSQKLHHAYLFTGTRGVGKTTIARIFAKSLVCAQGISSKPCNICELCVSVNEGNCLDVIEIDAASKTKVEDTRAILDNLAYSPNQARFKIYIIDEVHMLSNHSFNALLKSLEEPPTHIKFLLATTDPQKLPITILSRCLQLRLNFFQIDGIVQQLTHILTTENMLFEHNALIQIAKVANGSMRDALSLLEQILAFRENQDSITYQSVIEVLHIPHNIKLLDLLIAIIKSDVALSLNILTELFLNDCDSSIILQELQKNLKDLIILQLLPDYDRDDLFNKDTLLEISNSVTAEDLQLYYEIVMNGFKNLAFMPDVKVGLEMLVLRMIAFKQVNFSSEQEIEPKNLEKINILSQSNNISNLNENVDNKVNLELNFMNIIPRLKLSGLSKELVKSSVFEIMNPDNIQMVINEEQKLIATGNNIQIIENSLSEYFNKPIKVKIEFKNFLKNPLLATKTFNHMILTKEQNFIANDCNISGLIKDFNGQVTNMEGLVDDF